MTGLPFFFFPLQVVVAIVSWSSYRGRCFTLIRCWEPDGSCDHLAASQQTPNQPQAANTVWSRHDCMWCQACGAGSNPQSLPCPEERHYKGAPSPAGPTCLPAAQRSVGEPGLYTPFRPGTSAPQSPAMKK